MLDISTSNEVTDRFYLAQQDHVSPPSVQLISFFFFVTTGPYSNDVSEFTQHVLPIIVVLHKRAVNSPHVLNFDYIFADFFLCISVTASTKGHSC